MIIFVLSLETGFYYVVLLGLELSIAGQTVLKLRDPPASVS